MVCAFGNRDIRVPSRRGEGGRKRTDVDCQGEEATSTALRRQLERREENVTVTGVIGQGSCGGNYLPRRNPHSFKSFSPFQLLPRPNLRTPPSPPRRACSRRSKRGSAFTTGCHPEGTVSRARSLSWLFFVQFHARDQTEDNKRSGATSTRHTGDGTRKRNRDPSSAPSQAPGNSPELPRRLHGSACRSRPLVPFFLVISENSEPDQWHWYWLLPKPRTIQTGGDGPGRLWYIDHLGAGVSSSASAIRRTHPFHHAAKAEGGRNRNTQRPKQPSPWPARGFGTRRSTRSRQTPEGIEGLRSVPRGTREMRRQATPMLSLHLPEPPMYLRGEP